MNTKNNKQFKDSDVRMKEVMLELMNTTAFSQITVRLICEKAGVNRSTFYAHYTDIYDMIWQMETNLRKKLMNNYPASREVIPFSLASFIPFLKFIREHRDFYRIALKARQEFPLKQGRKPLMEQIVRPLCLKAGFTMILKRWVEDDCVESEEKIARIIRDIVPSIWKNESDTDIL